jgi:hypothetical protein
MRYLRRDKLCPVCNCWSNIAGREIRNKKKKYSFLKTILIDSSFYLEEATSPNVHNMIRRVIEQRNKKHALEYGWLSKTDMTIVAVSILFVILLAIINLILFAVRR